jgi:hypothetical protein
LPIRANPYRQNFSPGINYENNGKLVRVVAMGTDTWSVHINGRIVITGLNREQAETKANDYLFPNGDGTVPPFVRSPRVSFSAMRSNIGELVCDVILDEKVTGYQITLGAEGLYHLYTPARLRIADGSRTTVYKAAQHEVLRESMLLPDKYGLNTEILPDGATKTSP